MGRGVLSRKKEDGGERNST